VLQVSNDAETGAVGTITLAVTPEEASRLVFAQEQGRVWFTLLPPNEAGVELPPVFQGSIR
jgi:Flp pilus assembly protein CpaB